MAKLKAAGVTPGLAVVIVGDDPASKVYVRNKALACEAIGMHSEVHARSTDTSEAHLIAFVRRLKDEDGTSTASWCSCRSRRTHRRAR